MTNFDLGSPESCGGRCEGSAWKRSCAAPWRRSCSRGLLFESSQLEALYCAVPVYFSRPLHTFGESSPVTIFVWLLPITRDEANFVKSRGWSMFEEELARRNPDLRSDTARVARLRALPRVRERRRAGEACRTSRPTGFDRRAARRGAAARSADGTRAAATNRVRLRPRSAARHASHPSPRRRRRSHVRARIRNGQLSEKKLSAADRFESIGEAADIEKRIRMIARRVCSTWSACVRRSHHRNRRRSHCGTIPQGVFINYGRMRL